MQEMSRPHGKWREKRDLSGDSGSFTAYRTRPDVGGERGRVTVGLIITEQVFTLSLGNCCRQRRVRIWKRYFSQEVRWENGRFAWPRFYLL